MKQASSEEISEYRTSIGWGFLEGVGIGLPLSFALLKFTDRRSSFKNAGVFPRTAAVAAPAVFLGITMMDHHSRMFDEAERKAHMHIHGELPPSKPQEGSPVVNFVSNNRYKFIVAGWAATLGGCFWAINRDPYQTRSQKIVQARVWAQGATVLMLIGSVLVSARYAAKEDKAVEDAKLHARNKDSWKRDLGYIREEK